MTTNEILRLATFAGEIMLSNGAEVWRVEDTMARILHTRQNSGVETFVTPTGIFAGLDADGEIVTGVRRIKYRTTHLGKVAMVNDFSRKLVSGDIPDEAAFDELQRINNAPAYPLLLRALAIGMSCGCFGYMFGGNLAASACSAMSGALAYTVVQGLDYCDISSVVINLSGSVIVALTTLILINLGFNSPEMLGETITGAIMPMLPGIAITNGIRDIVEGDYLSGTSRITDAILVAVSIATGVGAVLTAYDYIFGGYLL